MGHKKQWEFLKKKFEQNQLSHAYLFAGPREIGKKSFAKELAKLVNCKSENKPCQKCFSCLAIERESFPDLMVVGAAFAEGSGEPKGEIKIAQVREVQNFLSYKAYYGDFKTVIVDGAEKMNQEAQSCFLKTLEEPKGKTLIMLISSRPDMLLPTIFSRCQTIKFFKTKDLPVNPEREKAEKEILADLIPIINSSFADKFKYVKSIDFSTQNPLDIFEAIQKYFRNMLMAEIGVEKPATSVKKYSVEKIKSILALIENINSKMLFTNASPKLALEVLLMEI